MEQPTDQAKRAATYVIDDGPTWLDVVPAFVGVGLVLAAVAAMEAWWPLILAGWALLVAMTALGSSRRGRVERVVETH